MPDGFTGDFDTLLGAYTASSVNGLSEVASDDNSCTRQGGSSSNFVAQAVKVYRLAVDGSVGASGSFDLHVALGSAGAGTPPPPPASNNTNTPT
jgi:hypothetical protein